MKLHILAVLVIALSIVSAGQNTATLSTNLSFLTSNPATGNVEMKLVLVNCGQNNPRVISSWMIMSPPPPFRPDSTGHVAGAIIGNDKIDCGGTQAAPITPTLYAISYFVNNAQVGPTKMYNVLAGTTFDPTTATPSNPGPVPAPTWDSTYLRLDGVSPLGQAVGGQVPQFDATVGMYRPMTVGGFNLHSPGPIGDVTPGSGTFTSVNSTVMVNCPSCTDWGAAITAAMATCPTGFGGFKSCRVVMPEVSAGPWTTNVTVSNPNIALVGQGKMATNFSCTYNGDCLTVLPSTFTVAPGSEVSGFSIVGNGGANQNTLHIQDTIGRDFHNLFMDGASGASGSCVWLEAYQNWSERNILDIDTGYGCTKSWRFSANASNPGCPSTASCSLGYNRIYARMNPNTSAQIGMSWEGNLYFYEGELHTVINKDGGVCGATVFKVSGKALIYAENGFVTGEDNAVTPCGYFWDVAATAGVNFYGGYIYFPTSATNNVLSSVFNLPLSSYMKVLGTPADTISSTLPLFKIGALIGDGGTNPRWVFGTNAQLQYIASTQYWTLSNPNGNVLTVTNDGTVAALNNLQAAYDIIGGATGYLRFGTVAVIDLQGVYAGLACRSGTPTSSNFCRGDGTWSVPGASYLSGSTSTITGTALTATCDSGTATVTGAVVGSPVTVGTTDGTDIGGAFNIRGSVTATNVVTVYVCGTGTPASKAYSVRVLP